MVDDRGEDNRAQRSLVDHVKLHEPPERRDLRRAEALMHQHMQDFAAHVEKNRNLCE